MSEHVREEGLRPELVTFVGHAHLDLAWVWRPREARIEALETSRAAVELLEEHPAASFVMSQAVVYRWLAHDDPAVLGRIRRLVEAGRWEPVGGWWVEADLFGASPESIRRQGVLGQEVMEDLVGRRCTIGFSPDTFGHPDWLPSVLCDAGLTTYVITRPSLAESGLPPVFVWEGRDGARVRVARLQQYAGEPTADPSRLCLYGVGNHGGGPTRAHLAAVDAFCARGVGRHGSIASWVETVRDDDLPVVRGDLVHHARGCYATLVSFKERMRNLERRLLQCDAPIETWEPLLFWQFHDVLAGSCIEEVYEEAAIDLAAVERHLQSPVPGPNAAPTFIARHRVDEGRPVLARETLGAAWNGWVEVSWISARIAQGIEVDGHDAVLRRVEQHGTSWRLHALVHLALAPNEERELRWAPITGRPPVLEPPSPGIRMIVVEDGTDTWGHSLVSYGPEVELSSASRVACAGGPDGLVEVWGHWHERDRALKLVIPFEALDANLLDRFTDAKGEMPGGEWDGPIWGRIWSYDVKSRCVRVTLRRSPPYALHDPIRRVDGVELAYTDHGRFTNRLWLQPQPLRVPPELVTL
jgi:Glycosyl hydrolases family 38 N-terminal domain/Alpha mannosidase middle domain